MVQACVIFHASVAGSRFIRTHKFLRISTAHTLITDRSPPSITPIRDAYGFIAGCFCRHSLECRRENAGKQLGSRADPIRFDCIELMAPPSR